MFEDYAFEPLLCATRKSAMELLASFRPDAQTPAEVSTKRGKSTGPANPRTVFEAAESLLQLAHSE